MATTLALAMRASMSASGVVSGANQAAGAMDKMAAHAQKAAKDMSVLSGMAIGNAVIKSITVLTGAISSAASSLYNYGASVANALDHINDLAGRTGMAAESLQVLQMAARLSGMDDVTASIQKFTIAIGNAAESGNTQAFTNLGLNFAELQAMSPEDQFRKIQAAIAALPTEAERAAAAVAIFGKAGIEMLPLFEQNLAKIEERMRRLGAVVSDDQVAAIDEMNDALALVQATFDGIIGQVQGNLAPIVTAIAETFLSFVEGYESSMGDGGTGIANAITEGLFEVLEALAAVVDASVNAFNSVSGPLMAIAKMNMMALKGLGIVLNVLTGAASDAAGDTTFAQDTVASVRERFKQNDTPEARDRRLKEKERRDQERKSAAEAQQAADKDAKEAEKAREDAKKVTEGTRNAEEKHAEEMRRLDELREGNYIDEQTYLRAKAEADDKLRAENEKAMRPLEEARRRAEKDAEEAKRRQEEAANRAAAIDEKMQGKEEQVIKIVGERAAALRGKSNEALKANDIRSGEGMAQFLALATGREDPAIAEYRKQTAKLAEIQAELRALAAEKVEILGAAA